MHVNFGMVLLLHPFMYYRVFATKLHKTSACWSQTQVNGCARNF